jgi:HEAT repeat protein
VEQISDLVESLAHDSRNADALRKRPRAVRQLRSALVSHESEKVREACAEILGDLDDTTAVPELIQALLDKSVHVRFDALWALEKVLRVDLRWWLRVEAYKDQAHRLHGRVSVWWKKNRNYVWW